jgi:hypothetical protein
MGVPMVLPDVIIVPGGGLQRDGRLQPWVEQRLGRAKAIYDYARRQGSAPLVVTMNEGIRNTLRDSRGAPVSGGQGGQQFELESQLAKRFLEDLPGGMPQEDVLADNLSLDLVGNAYFPRTSRAFAEVAPRAEILCIVTNNFHMARTAEVFQTIFSLPENARGFGSAFSLMFEEVSDELVSESSLQARLHWERQKLIEFRSISSEWKDLHDVHHFIFPAATPGDRTRLPPSLSSEDLFGDQMLHAAHALSEDSREGYHVDQRFYR